MLPLLLLQKCWRALKNTLTHTCTHWQSVKSATGPPNPPTEPLSPLSALPNKHPPPHHTADGRQSALHTPPLLAFFLHALFDWDWDFPQQLYSLSYWLLFLLLLLLLYTLSHRQQRQQQQHATAQKKWKKLCHVNYWLTPARRQKCHGLKLLYSWAERIIFI